MASPAEFTAILEGTDGFVKHKPFPFPPPLQIDIPTCKAQRYNPDDSAPFGGMMPITLSTRVFFRDRELYPLVWLYKEMG